MVPTITLVKDNAPMKKVPVAVLTGFLGPTLTRQPSSITFSVLNLTWRDLLSFENELGGIGIDQNQKTIKEA